MSFRFFAKRGHSAASACTSVHLVDHSSVFLLRRSALLLALMAAGGGLSATWAAEAPTQPVPATTAGGFTPEQQQAIGELAATYIANHPEYLVAAQQTLQQQQAVAQQQAITQMVLQHQDTLLQDSATPSTGPAAARVAVIEFSDYQCVYCSRLAPVMDAFMREHPDVRFINKEFPIFASRWAASGQAAVNALAVWDRQGAKGYYTFRRALFATGHVEGKLTTADIAAALGRVGMKPAAGATKKALEARLDANLSFGQVLGLTGTPAVIVMPQQGASPDNITIFTGLPQPDSLVQAVTRANAAGAGK